jgi:hypothetical protein
MLSKIEFIQKKKTIETQILIKKNLIRNILFMANITLDFGIKI